MYYKATQPTTDRMSLLRTWNMPMPITNPDDMITQMEKGIFHNVFTGDSVIQHFGNPYEASRLMAIIGGVKRGETDLLKASFDVLDLMRQGSLSPMVMQLCFMLALPAGVKNENRTRFIYNLAVSCGVLNLAGEMRLPSDITKSNWLSVLDAIMLWLYDPDDVAIFSGMPGEALNAAMLNIAGVLFSQSPFYRNVGNLFSVRAFGEVLSYAPEVSFLANNLWAVYGPIHVHMIAASSFVGFPTTVVVWGSVKNARAEVEYNVQRWYASRDDVNLEEVRRAALISLASTSSPDNSAIGILDALIGPSRIHQLIRPLMIQDSTVAETLSLTEDLANLMMRDHMTMAAVALGLPWAGPLVPLQFKLRTLAIIRYGLIWPKFSPGKVDPQMGIGSLEPVVHELAEQVMSWALTSRFSDDECSFLLLLAIELYADWYATGSQTAVPGRELVLGPIMQLADQILRRTDSLLYDAVNTIAAVRGVDVPWLADFVNWDTAAGDIDFEELLEDFIYGSYDTASDSTPEEAIIHTLAQLLRAAAPSIPRQ